MAELTKEAGTGSASAKTPGPVKKTLQTISNNKVVDIVCRLVVGMMFLLSGIGKVMDLNNSVKAVYNFHLIPWDWAVQFIGYALPFFELIAAVCILTGVFTRLFAGCICLMQICFFFGKLQVMFVQHRSIDCGCFGALMNTMASVTVFMDIPMAILCLLLIFSVNRYKPGLGQLLSEKMKEKLRFVW